MYAEMMLYLSLGSNLGDRMANLNLAVCMIEERIGHVTARSGAIETEPWGFDSVNLFLNIAIAVETSLRPEEVLDITQEIERSIGRKEKSTDGTYRDRLIDIDLLMFGNMIIRTDRLSLPHPLMAKRRFVLEPLAQIAPALMHPVLNRTIAQLLESMVTEEKAMADNYLENHYEEYLRRKAEWERKKNGRYSVRTKNDGDEKDS